MTELYIISGFLGAGKTTCIQTMIRSALKGKKVAVIENDFGESSVDAALLAECSLTVTNLSSGCICCSLTGDFRRALEQIRKDYAPDVILVEPSGVGKLSDVVKPCISLEDQGKIQLVRTITVVDARFFDKYRKNYGEFYEDQILYADLILMSHQETCPDPQSSRIREKAGAESRFFPEAFCARCIFHSDGGVEYANNPG